MFVFLLEVVGLTGLIGMLTAILTSLNERRREMAILRSVGARPWRDAALFNGYRIVRRLRQLAGGRAR